MIVGTELRKDVLSVLDYNPDTGIFTWKKNGQRAGGDAGRGYWKVRVNKVWHRLHRLAWLITHGVMPSGEIDHINGISSDNRIANLRDVSKSANQRNRKKHREGRLFGATYNKSIGRWIAQISVDGQLVYLGMYSSEVEAHQSAVSFENLIEEQKNGRHPTQNTP